MNIALYILTGLLLLCMVGGFLRIFAGPGTINRMIAFDAVAISSVGILALLGILWNSVLFVELILIYALLGFVGTVALVLYLQKTIPDQPPNPQDKKEDRHE